ncbi:MAG TPA: aminotransferase class V-fold PLP-dependent enzyme [Bryobacterales bacterium]|nr:aminotransferase class V-fold PLP-dependent enzyme [Bryobacterales bacterium]
MSGLLMGAPAAGAAKPEKSTGEDVYARVGIRPFINMTASWTINGGLLTWPEVKQAMDQASYQSVNIDELMEKVGQRLAQLLQCEAVIVTSGCAGALTHATSACVAGSDPEKIQQLPRMDGLKDEVIMPKQSRNVYDHAIRAVGVKIVEVRSIDDFHAALSRRTAMIAVNASTESEGIRLEDLAKAARPAGVPILVDAAAHYPARPNPWLARGADLVASSGGKILQGPQCAGLLMGRKDLVQAAWVNSAPHHAFGRMAKVGKEEIMGMLAAVEVWATTRDLPAEHRKFKSWYAHITEKITTVTGVRTSERPPDGPNPFPVLSIEWDPKQIGLTAGELGKLLLDGEPRIASQAEGAGHSFIIRPPSMKPGDYKLVADRLYQLFSTAPKPRERTWTPPSAQIAGRWEVEVKYGVGAAQHALFLETVGNRVTGSHLGWKLKGDLRGTIEGAQVRLRSRLPYEGTALTYEFSGEVAGNTMSGEVKLGEYGRASWTARKHV